MHRLVSPFILNKDAAGDAFTAIFSELNDQLFCSFAKNGDWNLRNRKITSCDCAPEHRETQPDLKDTFRLAVGFS